MKDFEELVRGYGFSVGFIIIQLLSVDCWCQQYCLVVSNQKQCFFQLTAGVSSIVWLFPTKNNVQFYSG